MAKSEYRPDYYNSFDVFVDKIGKEKQKSFDYLEGILHPKSEPHYFLDSQKVTEENVKALFQSLKDGPKPVIAILSSSDMGIIEFAEMLKGLQLAGLIELYRRLPFQREEEIRLSLRGIQVAAMMP